MVLRQPDCDAKSITVDNVLAAIEKNEQIMKALQ
jgi:hypothetical protein